MVEKGIKVVGHDTRCQVPVSSELNGRLVAAVTAEIRPQTGGIVRKRLTSGLTAGERVVVEGLQKVRVGSVVSVADEAPASTSSTEASVPTASD